MVGIAFLAVVAAFSGCPAAVVHSDPNAALGTLSGGRWVKSTPVRRTPAAPILGFLFGGEVVDGRFAVYAGGVDPIHGNNEKVLWIIRPRYTRWAGPELAVTGRLAGVVKYRARFGPAWSEQTPGVLFPSGLHLPRPGCWSLTLTTGRLQSRLVVLAQVTPPSG